MTLFVFYILFLITIGTLPIVIKNKSKMKLSFLLWRFERAIKSLKKSLEYRDINYINADILRIARIAEKLLPYEESGAIDDAMIEWMILTT